MISFIEHLNESLQISASKKAYKSLSWKAREAIDRWESMSWTDGPLERAVKANDAVAQEIEQAFAPVRAAIPGTHITLYRGIVHRDDYTEWKKGFLTSWTDDKRVAGHFAGHNGWGGSSGNWTPRPLYPVRSEKEIQDLVDKYNRTGFAQVDHHKYIRSKDDPKYFNIYSRRYNHVTGSDNFEAHVRSNNEDNKALNVDIQAKLSKGEILTRSIPKSQIIWLTNNLNSKEYIVRLS